MVCKVVTQNCPQHAKQIKSHDFSQEMFFKGVARHVCNSRLNFNSSRVSFLSTTRDDERASVYFSITDKVGALSDILSMLTKLNISLSRIESRPSRSKGVYEFYVDFVSSPDLVRKAVSDIQAKSLKVKIVSAGEDNSGSGSVPWFPRKIADLDTFAGKVLSYGGELDADHPGFTDPAYRERRAQITKAALSHKHGNKLPEVDYTKKEIETWGAVFRKMSALYKTNACYEHQYIFPLLEQNCGYREDNIPQIAEVSMFLKDCTGWTIRPVMGLLSSRDFLNALAFRVFHSTQYIRHHSAPFYTPEPDICHELLGHAPLFADPDFAQFSQEVGLASLGATDEDLDKLAKIYWFTVEFGLCREGSQVKAFGAGLLSSFGELEYCLTEKPIHKPFNCEVMSTHEFPITSFQPVYFVADSFKAMKEEVRHFAAGMERSFIVHYNPLTQSVEVLDSRDKLTRFASMIQGDLTRLSSAIDKTLP